MAQQDTSPLQALRWQHRVIVVLASTGDGAAFEEQQQRLAAAADGLRERDVVVVTARDDAVAVDGAVLPALDAAALRQAYGAPDGGFQVVLIGKDGGVKLRAREPVALADVFALIDTMPMRRREMQEQGQRSG